MQTLNLGILAHVDAGKTTLTERLLFDSGAIQRLGSVDQGTSATDTMLLERRRGITIRTSVASFKLACAEVDVTRTEISEGEARIEGVIPTRLSDSVQRRLPDLTSGEVVWESRLDHHRAVRGAPPRRPRVGVDPGDWAAYVKAHPR